MSESATKTRLRHGIAEEVRVHLARKRMSATKLAQELGWTQQYMSRRMVGDQPFDSDDLEAIADALGVALVDLLPASAKQVSTRGAELNGHYVGSVTRAYTPQPELLATLQATTFRDGDLSKIVHGDGRRRAERQARQSDVKVAASRPNGR